MPLRSLLMDRAKLEELMEPDFFETYEGFSMDSINNAISSHIGGREDQSALIYALISFRQWHKVWVETGGISCNN